MTLEESVAVARFLLKSPVTYCGTRRAYGYPRNYAFRRLG